MFENSVYIRPELQDAISDITVVRDAVKGAAHIRTQKGTYLPRLGSQSNEEYDAYLLRAYFLGATSATLSGYESSVFRKPIDITGTDMAIMNIDGKGSDISGYCRMVFKEVLTSGRAVQWIAKINGEYYLILYKSEQLVNWISNDLAIFQEKRRVKSGNILEIAYEDSLRIIKPANDNGYSVSISAMPSTATIGFISGNTLDPVLLENNIKSYSLQNVGVFPVIPITPSGLHYDPTTVPLVDLAEANFDHYRLSADLRHGLHTAPYPVFFASGFPVDKQLKIGSDVAWVTNNASGDAGVLEYHGYALEHLLSTLDSIESNMVGFGARMLEHNKRSSETAEALRVRQAAQEASILGLVRSVSQGVTLGLKTLLAYRNNTIVDRIELDVALPTDLIETRLTSDELIALITGWQQGAIPDEMLEHNFRQGEMIPHRMTSEDFLQAIIESRAKRAVENALIGESNNGRRETE